MFGDQVHTSSFGSAANICVGSSTCASFPMTRGFGLSFEFLRTILRGLLLGIALLGHSVLSALCGTQQFGHVGHFAYSISSRVYRHIVRTFSIGAYVKFVP